MEEIERRKVGRSSASDDVKADTGDVVSDVLRDWQPVQPHHTRRARLMMWSKNSRRPEERAISCMSEGRWRV